MPGHKASGPSSKSGSAPRILGLEVKHFANVERNGERFDQPRGVLGKDSFAARRDDSVTVEGRLSRPAYAFLIAFRPDGTDAVCFPESENEAPPLTDNPRYPSLSRGVNYGLNEGQGLQLFALVVSSKPLPAYKAWRGRCGASPWRKTATTPDVVWRDDGANVEPLLADSIVTRGKGQQVTGKTPVASLTDWLRRVAANTFAKARLHIAASGLDRAAKTSEQSPLLALAAVLARNGKPQDAWQRFEESLGRGTSDDLSARLRRPADEQAKQIELVNRLNRLDQLIEKTFSPKGDIAELKKRRDDLLTRRRQTQDELDAFAQHLEKTYGPAAGQVFKRQQIQAALPPETALIGWLDIAGDPKAADPNGEHWRRPRSGCVACREGKL